MGTHVREQETLAPTALPTIGRRALVGGGLVALAAPALAHSAPEPMFAAIAEHTRLWEALEAACRAEGRAMNTFGSRSAEHAAAMRGVEAAMAPEGAALHRLLATVPATPAGLLAWLDHLGSPMGFGEDGPTEEEFPAILATMRAFVEVAHA
ncbi:hypothetical protein V5F29_04965 [Xanthobacter aminoxidans]|uniref:hypothetical protein n=1 Tax=Xanthobacter aminoxidans TaxID=186280 RepID=UPI003728EFF3